MNREELDAIILQNGPFDEGEILSTRRERYLQCIRQHIECVGIEKYLQNMADPIERKKCRGIVKAIALGVSIVMTEDD